MTRGRAGERVTRTKEEGEERIFHGGVKRETHNVLEITPSFGKDNNSNPVKACKANLEANIK